MDSKGKIQLNLKRKGRRELAEEAVMAWGTSSSEVETKNKTEEGHEELCHDIVRHYV